MKKALKITGIGLLIILAILVAIPFVFQSQIKEMVKGFINQNLNAKVEFSDVSLSLLSSFPQAHVQVDDLIITNLEPFKDETFATAKYIAFNMSVKELFKSANEGPLEINEIHIEETLITLKTNKFGDVNYDIVKEKETEIKDTKKDSTAGFSFDIKDYSIAKSAFTYIDEKSNTNIYITELNHSGKGIFSGEISQLDTQTNAKVSVSIDSTQYLNNNTIKLDAILDLDLENNKYTFKENQALINQLPIAFEGFVQLLENTQEIDITFENPGSSFKDFLAVIPNTYAKNLEKVHTTGTFKVNGKIKGTLSETSIPNLDINLLSNHASFKFPDLPKSVDNIAINASLKNDNGNIDNTYLDLKTLNFQIDEDVFKSSASLKNITKNMLVNANIDGILNLANITKAYPISLEKELSGILKGNIQTAFDMDAIKTNAYQRIKNNGNVSVSDFVFSSEDIVNPIQISNANLTFNPGTVSLNNFNARTGTSDIQATGTIENLLGFLLSDNKLKGNFKVNSNTFAVSDFMEAKTQSAKKNKTTSTSESLKIPAFLDCNIQADAKTVLYDNLTLKNVKGTLAIKDEKAILENLTSNIFGGEIAISGLVNTKAETPIFNMNLGIANFDISESFQGLDLLQSLVPIAKILQGKLNTTINLTGDLDASFAPNLNSVSGDAFAELQTTKIEPKNEALFNKLNSAIDFIDFEKLDLKDLKTNLDFNNGKVNVKPFNLNYKDIGITISGMHGFDKSISYNAVFNVPAKYLGSDINRLIGKINDPAVNNITIPITANIGGSLTAPNVKTDLTSGIANLTKQLIEIEKQKLLNQGSNQIKDLLNNIIKPKNNSETENNPTQTDTLANNTPKDSTKTNNINQTQEGIKNVLTNIFNKQKKKKDSAK